MPTVRFLKISTGFQWRLLEPSVQDGRVIAICDALGLTVEADTAEELREAIDSATVLLFKDLAREGELVTFCALRGIKYEIEEAQEIERRPPSIPLISSGHALSI